MALPRIVGHEALRETIDRAVSDGTLPQSILLHGPQGVGKERLGLWIAQRLLCEAPVSGPCGQCSPCQRIERLEHPDVHWFFPLPRPTASSPEKLGEALEDLRAEELQRWRENPLRIPSFERAPAHFLASIRTIQRQASMRPAAGSRAVFVIGDAELMVPQEASHEAANAFLKLLEEPPPYATLILTTSHPGALLPTIRSRVLGMRVGTVPAPDVAQLLQEGGLAQSEEAGKIAGRSHGSIRRAVRLATETAADGRDPERAAGRNLLIAALSEEESLRLVAALNQGVTGGRADLVDDLDSLAIWLRDLAAVAVGAADRVDDEDASRLLDRAVRRWRIPADAAIRAIQHVSAARDLATGNVNPQLIVADLLAKVRRELVPVAARPLPTSR